MQYWNQECLDQMLLFVKAATYIQKWSVPTSVQSLAVTIRHGHPARLLSWLCPGGVWERSFPAETYSPVPQCRRESSVPGCWSVRTGVLHIPTSSQSPFGAVTGELNHAVHKLSHRRCSWSFSLQIGVLVFSPGAKVKMWWLVMYFLFDILITKSGVISQM